MINNVTPGKRNLKSYPDAFSSHLAYLPIYLSTYLPTYLPIYLSTHLPIYPSTY